MKQWIFEFSSSGCCCNSKHRMGDWKWEQSMLPWFWREKVAGALGASWPASLILEGSGLSCSWLPNPLCTWSLELDCPISGVLILQLPAHTLRPLLSKATSQFTCKRIWLHEYGMCISQLNFYLHLINSILTLSLGSLYNSTIPSIFSHKNLGSLKHDFWQ